jgi:tetratricopeptide (TPR) repeat protein
VSLILSRPFLIKSILALGFALGAIDGAIAQSVPTPAEVQASAERERSSQLLRDAIQRIARRPNDPDALIDAGNASLALDDPNAALNFFTRANAARPSDGRIKLGQASANLRIENPFEALRLFDEAVKLGIAERAVAADRAVAFDLLGNFSRAQQDYSLAGTIDSSDSLKIKHAVSLSLSGKAGEADGLLVPLLQRNIGEAWRARAFMLAARGDFKESVKVTQGFMDARSATRFEPFLRRMPELTGAQQAAAIHFGHFPTRNVGRDSDAVRALASAAPAASNSAGDGRLIPTGKPLGTKVASGQSVSVTAPTKAISSNSSAASRPPVNAAPAALANSQNNVARTRILAAEGAAAGLSLAKLVQPVPVPVVVQVAPPVTVVTAPVNAPSPSPQVAMPPPVRIDIASVASTPATPAAVPVSVVTPPTAAPLPQTVPTAALNEPKAPTGLSASAPANSPAQPSDVQVSSLPSESSIVTLPQAAEEPKVALAEPRPIPVAVDLTVTTANTIPATAPVSAPVLVTPIASDVNLPAQTPSVASVAVPPSTGAAQDSVPAIGNFDPKPEASVLEPIAPAQIVTSTPSPAAMPTPTPTPDTSSAKAPSFDLESIVSAIEVPESEQQQTVVPVDLNAIKRAEPKKVDSAATAAKKEKNAVATDKKATPTEAQTPRIWVQISTGEVAAFRGDMRRYTAKNPDLFKGLLGWSSPWNKMSRLVVGPFDDLKAARKWESDFRKAGGNGFVWQSANGTVVEKLK